jgi:alanyl-tRNA synthetase
LLLSFALLWVLWPFALRCCFFAGFTLEAARSRSMHETQAGLTERLYYTDAYLRTFDAHIVQVRTDGARTHVALDRSAFYPTSGGQPHDTGMLAGARVVDVTADDGTVWHTLEGEPAAGLTVGVAVEGAIDWPRRYDFMQQHAGQHLLSQVFDSLFGYETVSVHFGPTESTLDLDTPALDTAQIDAAEQQAHAQIYAALPIHAYFVDAVQVAALPLRRPPKVSGAIRIVEIAGYDYSACGGTHVRTTAEIGPIKVVRSERRRGQVRLTFLCGGRAVADYGRKHTLLQEAAALFSTDIAQVPALAERALTQSKEAQRQVEDVTARLMTYTARELLGASAAHAPAAHELCVITTLRDDLDATALRTLAGALVADAGEANRVALLASTQGGKLLLAFARCGASAAHLHMGNLLRATLQQAGGNGGGRPDFAQGGGVESAEAERLLAWARAQVESNA